MDSLGMEIVVIGNRYTLDKFFPSIDLASDAIKGPGRYVRRLL